MANTIQLRKQYATMLDLVYKKASLTSILDGPTELIKEGANANEILIPKLDMQGLADYSRSGGYVDGDVTLGYETKKCAYVRRIFCRAKNLQEFLLLPYLLLNKTYYQTFYYLLSLIIKY